ncbi:MAG: 4-alpha-glucanotransferase [Bacteroidaceae bacterium]
MFIDFTIEYRTNWGEEVRLTGSAKELGAWDENKAIALTTTNGILWHVKISINDKAQTPLEYNYCIYKDGQLLQKEWNTFPRKLTLLNKQKYTLQDSWRTTNDQQNYFSSAFTECLLAHKEPIGTDKQYSKTILFRAFAPRVASNYALALSGNQKALGNWEEKKAVVLNNKHYPEWEIALDASTIHFPLDYKFVLYNLETKQVEEWEDNPNRTLANPQLKKNETYVVADRFVRFSLPAWKCAGVAVPVFSLKSATSYGIGDFGDLKKMIDWALHTHQKVVQILPINDTTITNTWTDSYPYNSISIYAFHPMYIDISQLHPLQEKGKMDYYMAQQEKLNAYTMVDYEAVNAVKWEYCKDLYLQEGKKELATDGFKAFFENNKEWLKPYAAFSHLRNVYKTANFREWPKYQTFNSKEIDKLCNKKSKDYDHIALYYFVQYHLHLQLLATSAYARKNGVVLKGDIPIGISRNSVEAWTEPHYFNLNGQAGAPPDDFSANGQNWGFPTYNWDVMAKDGYSWWMKRFQKMSEYFDAYRIDHILGFFRIWEIPTHAVHGLLGQFMPSLPMSKEEIAGYGLYFNESFFLRPFIHEYFLEQLFGKHVAFVKETFIQTTKTWEIYEMRPAFDTQKKVAAYFEGKTDADSCSIRDALYALISDVLFVSDSKDPNKFHPRISVQHDFIYRALSDNDKAAFNRLYDDYYYHRHNEYWHQQAMNKLPQLTQSTRMLVCGEDLGMIPDCVEWVMNDLQINSLEIQRMPKNPTHEFGHLNEYPYRSVCTISTHDMSTLRGWWEEDREKTQHYYNNELQRYGEAPQEASGEICEDIIRRHLYSNSMLCILSFQDWLAIDEHWRLADANAERINIPANPKHYWRYRIHLSIEELMQATSVNEKIKGLIEETARNSVK